MQPHTPSPGDHATPRFLAVQPMLFQQMYLWTILLAAMDVVLTWVLLSRNAEEVNPVARLVINEWGMAGGSAFKFALVLFAIVVCDVAGRRRRATGWRLAILCVLLNALPVSWSLALMTVHSEHLFR